MLQAHVTENGVTVFWIEGNRIIRKWPGDELCPEQAARLETVIGDLRLVYEAVEELVDTYG